MSCCKLCSKQVTNKPSSSAGTRRCLTAAAVDTHVTSASVVSEADGLCFMERFAIDGFFPFKLAAGVCVQNAHIDNRHLTLNLQSSQVIAFASSNGIH